MQAWLPAYFSKQLGLELSKSAGLSALPMITMAVGSKVAGQTAVASRVLRCGRRPSILVFALAVSTALAALVLATFGALNVAADVRAGNWAAFRLRPLCSTRQHGLR